jgi:predicted HicB family RNase H-like nuclease
MKKKFTTTIEEEILKELKIQAIKEDISVAELIEKMFSEYSKTFVDSSHD